jgi:AcrR family transcriptional regulator
MSLQRGERQAQRTKEALEKAFVQLIREKNYDTITISDITNRANTGRSTFYRYFPIQGRCPVKHA